MESVGITQGAFMLSYCMWVDVMEKKLRGVGAAADRTTPIESIKREDGRIVLHGGYPGRGWTAVILEQTGKLSAAVSEAGAAFIIFGACTQL
jgi:hypothetical protein